MFTLSVENEYGERLELTHNPDYVITSVDGLAPPDATINTTDDAMSDGSVFNSSFIQNRLITITLAVNSPAEENRLRLFKYCKIKRPCRVWYKNGTLNVYADGYVQNYPAVGYFEKKQVVQISILCPNPYFLAVEKNETEFCHVVNNFEFPFAIESPIPFSYIVADTTRSVVNKGDAETGALIKILATGAANKPKVANAATGDFFEVDISLSSGDVLMIDTRQKQKGVFKISGGVRANVIGDMTVGSTWFQLIPGDNVFAITAESGGDNLICTFLIDERFTGV